VYVGGLSDRTTENDVDVAFSKFGRIREIALKTGFCFVEFEEVGDAMTAVRRMNGSEIAGVRVRVQHSRARGAGPTPGEGKCYNCGTDGHWARECPDGDMSDKCYLCGENGHMQRDCTKKGGRRPRKGRSRSPRGDSKGGDRSRSRSKSRSPVREIAKNGDVAIDVEANIEDVELPDNPKEDKPVTPAGEQAGDSTNAKDEAPPDKKEEKEKEEASAKES